jgi:hypothetical protein
MTEKAVEQGILSAKEKPLISDFFAGLGTTDLEGQLCHCGAYERHFADKVQVARQALEQKGQLYRKFCLLGSVAVFIMLL